MPAHERMAHTHKNAEMIGGKERSAANKRDFSPAAIQHTAHMGAENISDYECCGIALGKPYYY